MKSIPRANQTYFITTEGKCMDPQGTPVPTKEIDGIPYILIDWFHGMDWYPVSLAVLITHIAPRVPFWAIPSVEVLYKDRNPQNIKSNNLFYRWKDGNPLESRLNPGYYLIPSRSLYAINADGVVVADATGKIRTTHTAGRTTDDDIHNRKNEYQKITLVNDAGNKTATYLHRVVMLAFRHPGEDLDTVVVNHLDGDQTNNRLSNLEWCTYSENSLHGHANGLTTITKSVVVKNLKTGEVTSFYSLSETRRQYPYLTPEALTKRLEGNLAQPYDDDLQFAYEGTELPPIDTSLPVKRVIYSREVIGYNPVESKLVVFTTAKQASEQTGVEAITIRAQCRNKAKTPWGGWVFRWNSEADALPEFNDYQIRIFAAKPYTRKNGVLAVSPTGQEQLYLDVEDAAAKLNTTVPKVRYVLDSDKLLDGALKLTTVETRN